MAAPRKIFPLLIGVIGVVAFGLIAWLGYELGRYRAGYALLDVRRAAELSDAVIAEQAGRIEGLERQIAIFETARDIDAQAYSEVESNLDDLESQIVDQQEQLRFLQGIVSPDDGEAGLRIQDFEVLSGPGESSYVVRLLLVQAIVHNETVTGSVELTLSGRDGGEPIALENAGPVEYAFRYFQSVDIPLALPPGFVAESVDVEVVPENPRGSAWSQRFAWSG